MKKPFQVGERVAVYHSGQRYVTSIIRMFEDGRFDTEHIYNVHPKQARRLKKKERRAIWVPNDDMPLESKFKDGKHLREWLSIRPDKEAEHRFTKYVEVKRK